MPKRTKELDVAPMGPRVGRLMEVITAVVGARRQGRTLSDADIIAGHPDLMPELAQELKVLRDIHLAMLEARRAGPLTSTNAGVDAEATDVLPFKSPDAAGVAPVRYPRIEGYQILGELGRGGQGVVFQALQETTGRPVAVKVLPGGTLAHSRERARFEREATALANLQHPNIVGILDRGRTRDGAMFLSMPCIEGAALDAYAQMLRETDSDYVRGVLRVFVRICRAIDVAHRSGIVHRDLKPTNIRIDRSGEPHVLDFGLARMDAIPDAASERSFEITRPDQIIGSIPWLSPEQVNGPSTRVDARSDIHALGVCLYQAITGVFPYPVMGSLREAFENVATKAPASFAANLTHFARPAALEAIVLKALAKDPERRYQHAIGLAEDLEALLEGRPIRGIEGTHRTKRPWRSAVMAVALVMVVPVIAFFRSRQPPSQPMVPPQSPVTLHTIELPSRTTTNGMTLLRVPAGEFLMGSDSDSDPYRATNERPHTIRISQPFWIGAHEVTVAQYRAIMEDVPEGNNRDDLPVINVRWEDAQTFCQRLGLRESRRYRLPSEAQWEYACRAGSRRSWAGTGVAQDMAWYRDNSDGRLHPVGQKRPNHWGIYDMHGNAAEWCEDRFSDVLPTDPTDPMVRGDDPKVVRGGAFDNDLLKTRSAVRDSCWGDKRQPNLGFRVVCEDGTNNNAPLPKKNSM